MGFDQGIDEKESGENYREYHLLMIEQSCGV